jgi:hypothetical protein
MICGGMRWACILECLRPATCDLLLRSTFLLSHHGLSWLPTTFVDSSLEAVIAHSTTQVHFPEIQDSALTDLTTVLGVGARSAAGYPGRIQERWHWRRSPGVHSVLRVSLFWVPANWTALFRLRRAAAKPDSTLRSGSLPLKSQGS